MAMILNEGERLYDCLFGSNCAQQDIIEAANLIFNMLRDAPMSKVIRDKHKQKLANAFNDGWHYQTLYAPERLEKVDF